MMSAAQHDVTRFHEAEADQAGGSVVLDHHARLPAIVGESDVGVDLEGRSETDHPGVGAGVEQRRDRRPVAQRQVAEPEAGKVVSHRGHRTAAPNPRWPCTTHVQRGLCRSAFLV